MMFYYDLVNFIVHIAFYVLICSSSDSSSSDSDSGKPRLVLFVVDFPCDIKEGG
jgi:hypothetical protein